MGRWLSLMKKNLGSPPPKLTKSSLENILPRSKLHKESFVSFGSASHSNFFINKIICCDHCTFFTPDKIGDGAGIGNCNFGVTWTQEHHGRMPLFRYAERNCNKFSQKGCGKYEG